MSVRRWPLSFKHKMCDEPASADPPFPTIDREDFRDSIRRHRESAWRVAVACALAYAALAFVVAALLSPILYGAAGLVLDLINVAVPAPDLLGFLVRWFSAKQDGPAALGRVLMTYGFAALPGLAIFALAALSLRRALLLSPMFRQDRSGDFMLGRPANPARLAEVQFVNTVEEMAIAAIVPAPRVAFVDGSSNAASFGPDIDGATILIGASLTDILSRSQMQGVAAFLVASITNGDMKVGMRMALASGMFSLIQRLTVDGWSGAASRRVALRLLWALAAPTQGNLSEILAILSNPLEPGDEPIRDTREAKRLTWRGWLILPFLGLILSGFLIMLVNSIVLGPLVSVVWRQRKYMADATAVQLTRDPDGLDGALSAIANAGASIALPGWAGHLCIVQPGKDRDSTLAGRYGLIYPSAARRHRALMRLGASNYRVSPEIIATPFWGWLMLVPLGTAFVGLFVLLIGLLLSGSILFSMMLTMGPAFALHCILR